MYVNQAFLVLHCLKNRVGFSLYRKNHSCQSKSPSVQHKQ